VDTLCVVIGDDELASGSLTVTVRADSTPKSPAKAKMSIDDLRKRLWLKLRGSPGEDCLWQSNYRRDRSSFEAPSSALGLLQSQSFLFGHIFGQFSSISFSSILASSTRTVCQEKISVTIINYELYVVFGGDMMSPFESQLIAVVIFGLIVSTLPRIINKWADSRSQPR